jgi:uncharacterized membrane protein YkvA (DUF1232 family)
MAKKKGWNIGLLGEALAILLAMLDKRTPLFAKLLSGLVLLYLISPVDFVPDFLPFLGWLDDLAIVPLGLWLASRFIPDDVLNDARARFSKDKSRVPAEPRNVTPDKPKLPAK